MTKKEAQKIRSAFANGYEFPFGGGFLEKCDMNEVNIHAQLLDELLHRAVEEHNAVWTQNKGLIQCSMCGFGMFADGFFFYNGECIAANNSDFRPNYCPNCGAKMND